jgi:hypothetical protein
MNGNTIIYNESTHFCFHDKHQYVLYAGQRFQHKTLLDGHKTFVIICFDEVLKIQLVWEWGSRVRQLVNQLVLVISFILYSQCS